MSEKTKFNSAEIDLESLIIQELTNIDANSTKSAELAKPVEPAELAELAELVEPVKLVEPVDSADSQPAEKSSVESIAIINAESIENSTTEEQEAAIDAIKLPKEVSAVDMSKEVSAVDMSKEVSAVDMSKEVSAVDMSEEANVIEFPQKIAAAEMPTVNVAKASAEQILAEQVLVEKTPTPHTTPSAVNSSLQTAEYLSIAQDKILELQKNIETLHEENANVAAAGELWKQRSNNSEQDLVDLKNKYDAIKSSKETEEKIFTITIEKQNKQMDGLKKSLEESELITEEKLSTYKLIASDLENRIAIIEREKLTLLDGKNKFISDLQKQINTLQRINANDKKKLQKFSNLVNEKERTLRNTIKLLRQTLISLEIGDAENSELSLVS